MSSAITSIEIGSLPLVAKGKVRELYKVNDSTLLMAVSDRISAYDVVLSAGIPDKGAVLCQISAHWFSVLGKQVPGLKHHLVSLSPPAEVSQSERDTLRGRCMQVRPYKVFPIEAIVRGYLAGSSWAEYKKKGTIHGIPQPEGLQCSEKLPSGPIYTPSTKAPAGQSDENISPAQAREIVGDKYADKIESLALSLYTAAHEYALEKGIVIADTKFEFGLDEETDEIVLIDEVLTPDSSRFWPAPVKVGQDQPSFDKQYLRDWLVANGKKGQQGVELPDEVVQKTSELYRDIFQRLTGKTLEQSLEALEK
ncbi:Phosphoribosylaminoimidazole-succinocarboxamide synthase-like protein [Paramyrothecium foliicola]|nr:Phosphoribosylaminoimidazole-succinocarboxamide synthase-like protein [Paramyrothecium foliicola]